jgi:hypothetical protein
MSEISKQALKVDNSTSFPNNTTGYISPTILRAFNINMIDSLVDEIGYNADSASWNISIGQLNTYTASFAPSLTQLNAFTASQLTINTGYNGFTQSANQELDSLSAWTGSWNTWTSSINEIRDDGILQGYSTRFYFGGLVSASIVQNVNGPIASINIEQDGTKLNTSSFNDYTQSTAATQLIFSASVATSISSSSATFTAFSQSQNSFNLSATASIVELLNLSSSLSGGYATQGELDQSSSVLQGNIDTVSSSTNARINVLSSFTGSYATTGSNSFIGNQIVNGVVSISGTATYDLDITGGFQATSASRISGSNGIASITQVSVQVTSGSGANLVSSIMARGYVAATSASNQIALYGGISSIGNFGSGKVGGGIAVSSGSVGSYYFPIEFQASTAYTDGRVTFNNPISASAGIIDARISGSTIITGSVFQNVSASSITSQTASIDLSATNYFTLTLSGSTRINVTNPQPGVTATLVINTDTGASASFSSNVKQPSGSFYAASPSGNIDIISFTAVDSTTVYAFPAQSFV